MEQLYPFKGTLLSVTFAYRFAFTVYALLMKIKVKLPPSVVAAEYITGKQSLSLFIVGNEAPRCMTERGRKKLQFSPGFKDKLMSNETKVSFRRLF